MDFYSLLLHDDAFGISAAANTGCTAGALSIGLGYEEIKNGTQTIIIYGGAEELNPTSTRNNEPEKTPRPFDKYRDGLVIARRYPPGHRTPSLDADQGICLPIISIRSISKL